MFNVMLKVQDTVIHLEVDEGQWKTTQGSKRQAKWVWSPRTMSGLRLPDTLHAQHQTQRSTRLYHVLWDRNPGFLKSEVGPFSDFKKKSYLMGLKSAHSQESDFQESGEVDRFLKMGREIGLS